MLYLVTFADGDRGSLNDEDASVFASVTSINGSLKIFFTRRWTLVIGLMEW